ncbi:linear amide C-N hydrolase [Mollicutes bacterium LVI A0039]|nr:linear amide C-N hydrolase [Mollicutes bacterium LVI A0039]
MCTKILAKDKANNIISMRTMEAAIDLEYEIAIIPRNYECNFTNNENIIDLGTYKTKYAVMGARDFLGLYGSKSSFHEAMNEAGLSIGANAFRNVCRFPIKDPADFKEGDFDGEEILNYIISNFKTVDEVRNFIDEYQGRIFMDTRLQYNTTHIAVSDATGATIVIEPIDGIFEIVDNPMNVITNAPTQQAHFANLSNYMHLSPYEATNSLNFQNETGGDYTNMSSGTGANGLPGNNYSMSRFIRGCFFQRTIVLDDNQENSMRAMWSVANNFDIPLGSSREKVNPVHKTTAGSKYWLWSDMDNDEVVDLSVFTMVQDQTNGIIQYKDWKNNSIREVNMHDYDLAGSKIISVQVYADGSEAVQKVELT